MHYVKYITNGDGAMNPKAVLIVVLLFAVLVTAVAAQETLSPAETVEAFYDWYLGYIDYDRDAGTFNNPLVDRAYRDAPYLAPDFIDEVDALLDSFTGGGYDPFLCAQDFPESVTVAGSMALDVAAVVLVETGFVNHALTVDLELVDEAWMITAIHCPFGPLLTAEAFYIDYLEYAGYDPDEDVFRNPLVDGYYADSPYLSEDFIAHVDDLVEAGLHADPILCAQDIPTGMRFEQINAWNDRAQLRATSSFPNHAFVLGMIKNQEGRWQIDRVACGPADVVEAFYDSYLYYARYMGNPMVDSMYDDSPYLSADFIADVDALLEEGINHDPFLCAQDIPMSFSFEDKTDDDIRYNYTVSTSFEGHSFVVETGEIDHMWRITAIHCGE